MKKNILKFSVFMLAVSLTFSSCKKDSTSTPTTADDTAQQSTTASDEANVSSETDQAANDANAAISGSGSAGARIDGYMNPDIEGATVDSSAIASTKTLVINYDSTITVDKNNKTRSGSISVQLTGTHWKDPGSMLTLTFHDFKVRKISNGKFIVINGTKTITNINGGLIKLLGGSKNPQTTVVHHIVSSGLTIKFEDNTTRSWNVNRTRTFSGTAGNYQVSTIGTGTTGSFTNAVTWGTNRNGETFVVTIDSPLVTNNTCGWRKPVSGQKTHHIAKSITVIFGLDPIAGCGTDYKITWTSDKGVVKSATINY